MARIGETDPRWIVEDRPDHVNVNNWHWSEKNCLEWSCQKLKELLKDLKICSNGGDVKISSVESITGEATANNRKAKLIFLIDLCIKLKWEGELDSSTDCFKGTLDIPNFDDVNDLDGLDIDVTCDDHDSKDNAFKLKQLIRKEAKPHLIQVLTRYLDELRQSCEKTLILPSKDSKKCGDVQPVANNVKADPKPPPAKSKPTTNQPVGVKLSTKSLTLNDEFICPPEDIFGILLSEEKMSAVGNAPAQFEKEAGGRFSWFGGFIMGVVESVNPSDHSLKLRCRMQPWPSEHYSNVTLSFQADKATLTTKMELKQTGIPENMVESMESGWRRNIFERIKMMFGIGTRIG